MNGQYWREQSGSQPCSSSCVGKTVVMESFWVDGNRGDQGRHMWGEARGRQCSEQGVGNRDVTEMDSLGQDGVLSVAEVEEGDSHWCEGVKSSG